MILEPHGPRCRCGSIGCLEALSSGPAIAREARRRIEEGAQTIIADRVGGDRSRVTARVVGQAAQEGDEVAIELIRRAGFYIGVGIVNLIHLFNPRLFVIGGGVSQVGDLLFDPIRATVRERAMPAMRREVRIVPAALGDDVVVLGAVALVLSVGEGTATPPSQERRHDRG
jgi:glucokinase